MQTGQACLHTVSLLLCCFASGLASFVGDSDTEQTVFLRMLTSFAFSIIGTLTGKRSTSLFALLAICTCACICLIIALPSAPTWLPTLMFSGFWLLEIYAIAWFSQASGGTEISPRWALGLVALYTLSSLNNGVGAFIPRSAAYATALFITVAAFALASLGANMITVRRVGAASKRQETIILTKGKDANDMSGLPLDSPAGNLLGSLEEIAAEHALTPAESGVFSYLARGYSLKQISLDLGISESTAKYHRRNIYQKCGVSSRQELINLAARPQIMGHGPNPRDTEGRLPS